jgi:hypothetical protein
MQIDKGSTSDCGAANELTFDLISKLERLCAGSKAGATIDSSSTPDDNLYPGVAKTLRFRKPSA